VIITSGQDTLKVDHGIEMDRSVLLSNEGLAQFGEPGKDTNAVRTILLLRYPIARIAKE
jgi:hypothetical protein